MLLFFRQLRLPYKQSSKIWPLMIAALLWSASCSASALIEQIRISGNEVTHERIIHQEMMIKAGDPADIQLIEKSRQAIMDLGLFRSVSTKLSNGESGQILDIKVDEKYYFFPIPRLKRSADGEISYGAQLRYDNLAGLNQRLKLTYETERNCCALEGDLNSTRLDYEYPRLSGTHYDLFLGLEYIVAPTDTTVDDVVIAEHKEQTEGARVRIRRWLNKIGPSSGWSISTGWFWRKQQFEYISGLQGAETPGRAAGLSASISYEAVHDYLFSRGGTEYGYDLSLGLDELGSDSTYSISNFYYRRYWPIGRTPHQNLNFQLQLGFSGGTLALGDFPFSVGGSRDLRAIEKNSIEGNSFFAFNIEYLTPLFDHNAFRGVIFLDMGNAYDDNRVIDPGDIESGAGIGFRYKLKSFVNLQIRGDVAYSFSRSDHRAYIGTKHAF